MAMKGKAERNGKVDTVNSDNKHTPIFNPPLTGSINIVHVLHKSGILVSRNEN